MPAGAPRARMLQAGAPGADCWSRCRRSCSCGARTTSSTCTSAATLLPELTTKLERHGFRVLRISYNNFFVFPLAAGIILLRRGRREPKLASPHFDEDAYQVEMEPASPVVNTVS